MLLDMNATRQHCKEAESTKMQQRPWQWRGLAKKSRATRKNNTGENIQPLHPLSLLSYSPTGSQSCSQREAHSSSRQQQQQVMSEAGSKGRDSHNTSLRAHIRAMEPMLLVMVIKVALARSSLLTDSLFSLLIMFPKL